MSEPGHLKDMFLASLPSEAARCLKSAGELGPLLSSILRKASTAWPDIDYSEEKFMQFLGERMSEPVQENLHGLWAEDMYLVAAVLAGNQRAFSIFYHRARQEAERVFAQMGIRPTLREDALQEVFASLLANPQGSKLRTYEGRGSLWAWFRILTARRTLKLLRRTRRETALDPSVVYRVVHLSTTPETRYLRAFSHVAFKEAFAKAFARLEPKERNLLRYYVSDSLSIDQIAPIYRVHRATVARWLARIRAKLLKETKCVLRERLDVDEDEFQSIITMIHSRLDASLSALLRRPG